MSAGSALVTGGGRRIGAAFVRALAADGYRVLIHYHAAQREAEDLSAELRALGHEVDLFGADMGSTDEPVALAAHFMATAGEEIVVINNASLFHYDRLRDFTLDNYEAHQRVNVRGPLLLIREILNRLREDQHGLVLNMLDAKLRHLNPDYFSYTMSKWAMLGLHELLCLELPPRLRVMGISPGITLVSGTQTRENFAAAHRHNLLGRGVNVADIVAAMRYALTTPTVHGDILTVDAGLSMMGLRRDVAFALPDTFES